MGPGLRFGGSNPADKPADEFVIFYTGGCFQAAGGVHQLGPVPPNNLSNVSGLQPAGQSQGMTWGDGLDQLIVYSTSGSS